MENLMTVSNVRGYLDENGNAYLNVEDVARGLGFTEVKEGEEYVIWKRVNLYLSDLGFSTLVSKEDFIPENIFYKLCSKANNETAQKFQALVTDEVLPSIRKTGGYVSSYKHDNDTHLNKRITAQTNATGKKMRTLDTSANEEISDVVKIISAMCSNKDIDISDILTKYLKK